MTADRLDLDGLARASEEARSYERAHRISSDIWFDVSGTRKPHEDEQADRYARFADALDAAQAARNAAVVTARNRLDEIHRLRAETETAQAALARVEALHYPVDGIHTHKVCAHVYCLDHSLDQSRWPCATTRAIAGEGQEAG